MKYILRTTLLFLGLVSCLSAQAAHSNTIRWTASTSTVAGYNVYRYQGGCNGTPLSNFTKLTTTPITVLTYTDTGMLDGAVNCYYVTAVGTDAGKTESQSSGTVQVMSPIFTANIAPAPAGSPTVSVQ